MNNERIPWAIDEKDQSYHTIDLDEWNVLDAPFGVNDKTKNKGPFYLFFA